MDTYSTRASDAVRQVVIDDAEALEPHLAAWDELAVACARPYCAPGWMLSWWRHTRTPNTELRVILVFDGDELVGVGPFFAQRGALGLVEMRLLTAGISHRIGPLARPGHEPAVARALADALAAMRPASVVLEGEDAADPWPELLRDAWPGRRPRLRVDVRMDAPAIDLAGDFDAWMERRERRFRKEARRTARRMEEEGVATRLAWDPPAIDALLSLHYARWDERGGSDVPTEAREAIEDAAAALGEQGRLAVALLEGPDGPISAELVLRAGATLVFWGGGFDPDWSRHAPGTQTMLLALRGAAQQGVQVADLGGGAHAYKQRLADSNRPLAWHTLFPRGARYPLIRLRLAPKHVWFGMRGLVRRLPPGVQDTLRKLRR